MTSWFFFTTFPGLWDLIALLIGDQVHVKTSAKKCSNLGGLIMVDPLVNIQKAIENAGRHTKSYWKLPFIVDVPIKKGDFQ